MRSLFPLSIVLIFCVSQNIGGPILHKENFTEFASLRNDIPRRVKRHSEFLRYGKAFIDEISDLQTLMEFIINMRSRTMSVTLCLSCKFAIGFYQHYIKNGATEDNAEDLIYKLCVFFKLESPHICLGLVKAITPLLTNTVGVTNLSSSDICLFILKECGIPTSPQLKWTIPLSHFSKTLNNKRLPPKHSSPVYRVLHISDLHVDPYYSEGSNANCGDPLCCRETSGKPDSPEDAAGYWGDQRTCDIPLRTVENMLSHINSSDKIDYVLFTGDIPPHDVWSNTKDEVIFLLHKVTKMIRKYFGSVPIFPTLGNHESSPPSSFPPPEIVSNYSVSWLYEEFYKTWGSGLPGNANNLRLGGYYTHPVDEGLRIISLNMNYCLSYNGWLILHSNDPSGQLAWLVKQLQLAENKGEKVHIIGHAPPGGTDCAREWSNNYYKIINRYESTVTAQFFGHTHTDEFYISYDESNKWKPRATSISYVASSVTTFDTGNPSYRIYTVDGNYPGSSRVVLDYETYVANLTEGNRDKRLKWEFQYSAKEAYNMTSLLPSEWDHLVQRFEKDDAVFQKFYRYYYKKSESQYPPCDEHCKNTLIRRMRVRKPMCTAS